MEKMNVRIVFIKFISMFDSSIEDFRNNYQHIDKTIIGEIQGIQTAIQRLLNNRVKQGE